MTAVESYWVYYAEAHNLPKDAPYSGEILFGSNSQMSANLLALVLTGQKKATCSALEAFEIDNEKIPRKGNFYVITDWDGNPRGILTTTDVHILPYKDVTWNMAQKEGEDDCMESWIRNHDEFFEEDSDILGYQFTPDMPVVFEEFCLLSSQE